MHNHSKEYEIEHDNEHEHSITEEVMCHFPYAVFSVAFGLAILSFISFVSMCNLDNEATCKGAHLLFHSFHFMHIVFAATGTLITYFRFSKNIWKGMLIGAGTAAVFCTLSDSVLPYLGGKLLGVDMHFHLCFISEIDKILPFLFVGLLNGYVMSKHHASRQAIYSIFSHFVHILVSSFAAMFYLVSHGFVNWSSNIGFVFLFLIIAVVVPCTFSDVVAPMFFAKGDKKK